MYEYNKTNYTRCRTRVTNGSPENKWLLVSDCVWPYIRFSSSSSFIVDSWGDKFKPSMYVRSYLSSSKLMLDAIKSIWKYFREKVPADDFTSKIEAGLQHWNGLKKFWIIRSTVLKEILVSDNQLLQKLSKQESKGIEGVILRPYEVSLE